MSADPTLAIARAVLWEGYALYPYRASALKNRRRLLFGTLVPRRLADPRVTNDSCEAAMDCLLVGDGPPRIRALLRFLRLGESAVEHTFHVEGLGSHRLEAAADGEVPAVSATLTLSATPIGPGAFRVRAAIANESHDAEMGGAHVVLRAEGGRFVSLLDPPASLSAEAARCERAGLHPILVGEHVLGSAIILEDQPRIAPESAGDLFDGSEIEEILSLRILTLTDEERAEVRSGDPRVAALLDRVERLEPSDLARLHGALRATPIGIGDRVRVRPTARADALDVLLGGMDATVVAIESTVDGELIAVTIDRDPGQDLGEAGFPGHRFMFRADELEPRS